MKIREGFAMRRLANVNLVMKHTEDTQKETTVFSLNETGALLFGELEKGSTKEELADALCREYSVDRETAEADICEFLHMLEQGNILEA